MKGYLLLEGGAEFTGRMEEPDRRAIELAGGVDAPIVILPAAAALDHNDKRAGSNGVNWFQKLGARNVVSLPLIGRESAGDPAIVQAIRSARLIFLLGGFPGYLADSLADSQSWQALLDAYANGAVIAGSSAGAMIFCSFFYDPYNRKIREGMSLIPNTCLLPHYNSFGETWVRQLASKLPQTLLIGIDEETGILDDCSAEEWTCYGKGNATLIQSGKIQVIPSGECFRIHTG